MKTYCYHIIFLLLFAPGVQAQDIVYRLKYQQYVVSNYNNLLSGSNRDDFKQYTTSLSAWLNISFTDSNRVVMQIIPFDTFATAVHLSALTVWAQLNENRKIDRLYFNGIPPRQDEITIKTLLSFIQYFQVGNIPVGSSSEEEFIDGIYHAVYSNPSTDRKKNIFSLSKQISAIETPASAENLQRIIFDHYRGIYYANASTGFIDSIAIVEKKHQKIQNKIIAFIRSSFECSRVEDRKISDRSSLLFDSDKMYSTRLFNRPDPSLRNKLISERVLQSQPFDSLLNRLKAVQQLSFEQRVQLAAQLRAFLYLNPAKSIDYKSLLESYPLRSDEYSLLLDAIVNTPLPEAQHIISSLVEQYRNDPSALRGLLPKAAGAVLPGQQMMHTLLDLKLHTPIPDISSMSGLCLSNLLRTVKYSMPILYDSIVRELQQFYDQQEKNEDNTIRFLLEAGNIGDTVFVNPIASLVKSTSGDLQREALYSLRFMQHPKVDTILAAQLSLNPDSTQFVSIYETMKTRHLSPVLQKAVLKYLSQQGAKNEKGCQQLLTYLANYVDESPGLPGGLRTVRSTPTINDAINDMLEKYRSWQELMK